MESTRVISFLQSFSPSRLTGPIFDKELRVASRRRRQYALRSLYIVALSAFVGVVWLSVVRYQGSGAFVQSRMAAAGQQIVQTVVIFQFLAMQVLAVVMLSSAISDEVYHRTLGMLMSTPISSLQIVLGKLLSRLLQLVLLLAISLPILAIVRVLGGVPWEYLLSSLCITLTASIFAGSISLLLSIRNRLAYGVIIRTLFILFSLYFILPAVLALAAYRILPSLGFRISGPSRSLSLLAPVLVSLNPFSTMLAVTQQMLSPGGRGMVSVPLHGGFMLGLSALVLARAVAVVRRVALRQAVGQHENEGKKVRRKEGRSVQPSGPLTLSPSPVDGVRRVTGPPVVWKELRAPFIQGIDRRNSFIGLGATIAALAFTYWGAAYSGSLDEDFIHTMYVMLFVFLGCIVSIVFSATRITAEKESQSWMLLLTTPLSDEEILLGKAASALRRCLPIWGLLAGHVFLFTLVRYIHPIAILHLLVLVAWLTCFIVGSGLYFSARLRRSTSAVVASLALLVSLWIGVPILAGLLEVTGRHHKWFSACMWAHPVMQTSVIMTGAGGWQNAHMSWRSLQYSPSGVFHPSREAFGPGEVTWILLAVGALYTLAGVFFFCRAKRWLRRKVF